MTVPETTFALLGGLVSGDGDVARAMETLLDACAEIRPHPTWARLKALDYAGGAQEIAKWLDQTFSEAPPPPSIDGVWIGLFTAAYDDGERAEAYVHGGAFDPADADWSCTPTWKPPGSYANSNLLRDAHRIIYEPQGLGVDGEYPSVLAFTALAVAAWARNSNSVVERQLVVGFDEGDLMHVGSLGPSGFTPIAR